MRDKVAAAVSGLAMLASLTASSLRADSTKQQVAEQATGRRESEVKGDQLKEAYGGRLNEILGKFAYLDAQFQLMDEFGVEEKLEASLGALRKNPRAADDLVQLYKLLTDASAEDHGYFGEARWRTLHVLGDLRSERVTSVLFDIATQRMPGAGRVNERQYAIEYRLRARAIAGLEKLRQTDFLRRIYEEKGLFSGLAAASLYELGEPPRGITVVDGRKVLGPGDPKDYSPKRGETPEKLPPGQVSRKPGDDDEPAVSPGKPRE
jgi:hypothetical protein